MKKKQQKKQHTHIIDVLLIFSSHFSVWTVQEQVAVAALDCGKFETTSVRDFGFLLFLANYVGNLFLQRLIETSLNGIHNWFTSLMIRI